LHLHCSRAVIGVTYNFTQRIFNTNLLYSIASFAVACDEKSIFIVGLFVRFVDKLSRQWLIILDHPVVAQAQNGCCISLLRQATYSEVCGGIVLRTAGVSRTTF